jgi:transposase-like protein
MDLDSIYLQFPKDSDCVAYLESLRWGGKPMCPYCKRKNSTPIRNENRHHCNVCNLTFSVTVGTLFHGTRIPLQKWFLAIGLILKDHEDPTVRALAAALKVNKNTASFLLHRIRQALIVEISLPLAVAHDVIRGNHEQITKGDTQRRP